MFCCRWCIQRIPTCLLLRGSRTKPLKNYRSSADLTDERWKRIVDFQSRVGIRRAELGRLTGKDFVKKSDGTYNIFIKNGKGGIKLNGVLRN